MIDIGLKVDIRQLTKAREELRGFAEDKKKAGAEGVDTPMDVYSGKQSGNSNFNTSAEKASKATATFRTETERAKKNVADMVKDFEKIIKITSAVKTDAFGPTINLTSQAESERMTAKSRKEADDFWKAIDIKPKRMTAGESYFQKHGNYGRIAHEEIEPAKQVTSAGSDFGGLKKALGWTMAAAGGFSLLGFLSQARGKYQQSVGHEATLAAMGVRGGSNAGINSGVGPLEYMQLMEGIGHSGGMGGKQISGAARLSAAFARANGIAPDQAGSVYGTMYQATGNGSLGNGVIAAMEMAIKKGMDKARVPELLSMVARNTNVTSQAMRGAGISTEQAGTATALATVLMGLKDSSTFKQFGKSSEFFNVAQNGLNGAGSPVGDIMIMKELGLYNGEMSWDKMFNMSKMREGGFLQNPKALSGILSNLGGTQEGRAAQLMSMFPQWNLSTKSAMSLIDIDKSGLLSEAAQTGKSLSQMKAGSKSEQELAAKLEGEFGQLPGAGKMTLNAMKESTLLNTGDKLDAAFNKLERSALKAADALLDTKAVNSIVQGVSNTGDMVRRFSDFYNNPTSDKALSAGKQFNRGLPALMDIITPDVIKPKGNESLQQRLDRITGGQSPDTSISNDMLQVLKNIEIAINNAFNNPRPLYPVAPAISSN